MVKFLCFCLYKLAEASSLKCFKFVERQLHREILRVALNDAGLSTSVFSGIVTKLHINVSRTNWPLATKFSKKIILLFAVHAVYGVAVDESVML